MSVKNLKEYVLKNTIITKTIKLKKKLVYHKKEHLDCKSETLEEIKAFFKKEVNPSFTIPKIVIMDFFSISLS